jgi:ATP-dependent RNA helicase RhlE
MRFTDYPISIEIKKELAELGFKKPTDIQFKSIQHILDGEDLFAIAQTGTGKTAAFVIPVLDVLSN